MRIAVIGASGRIGAAVAEVLKDRGHEVVPITRGGGVDVHSGAGLAAALRGVDVVVDAANAATTETAAVTEFFDTVAHNVQREAAAAGVRHIVLISIIGIDRFSGGHYAGKLAHERAYLEGPLPVRILRAAQFHEFAGMMIDWTTRGDTAYIPKVRTQPVAAATVAERLADLATAETAPARTEVAGPGALNLVDAAAALIARRGGPAHVEEIVDTADPDHETQAGDALLAGPDTIIAGPTFAEWLDQQYPAQPAH